MPLVSQFQRDIAYRTLLDLIASGRMSTDTAISERQFAELNGFSRTPVREAMKALARDGLLEIRPARGTFVRRLSQAQLAETFEVRHLLETKATALAAIRGKSDDFALMRKNLKESRKYVKTDIARVCNIGADFHIQIVRASGNDVLLETYLPIRNRFRVAMSLAQHHDRDWVVAGIEEHLNIVSAMEARDASTARRLMSSHLKRSYASKKRILTRLRSEGRPGRLTSATHAEVEVR